MSPDLASSGVPVLVLRALGLGDALTAVPALRALRRRLPGSPLLLAAHGEPAELLRDNGIVDAVVPTHGLDGDPPGLREPLRGVAHVAVNLHGRGPQSHRLLQGGDPAWLWAFACREAGVVEGPRWSLPDRDDGEEHEVARWCRLVDYCGAHSDPADLLLPVPSRGRYPRGVPLGAVVVHPGAAAPSRRWPPERWATVAGVLHEQGYAVVVTGGPAEEQLVVEVVERAGLPPSACLGGRLSLQELAALVASSSMVLCGDTGVAHLATAFATPSVVLFGPVSPARWGPPRRGGRHVALWRGDGAHEARADPHGRTLDPALDRLSVDDVLAAAASLRANGFAA